MFVFFNTDHKTNSSVLEDVVNTYYFEMSGKEEKNWKVALISTLARKYCYKSILPSSRCKLSMYSRIDYDMKHLLVRDDKVQVHFGIYKL